VPTLASSDDLRVYLGDETIDATRADLMLQMAQDLCTTIVNPLPTTAKAVVLAVAARVFDNPTAATTEAIGGYSVARAGGLWLTRADKAALRRLAGGSGAFSIDTLPTGVSAVQTIAGTATAGTFRIGFAGQFTAPLAYNAAASVVEAALAALGAIGAGNVSVSGAWVVSFVNDMSTTPVPLLILDQSSLTGSLSVTMTRPGVFKPGQGLPSWDFDYQNQRVKPIADGVF
jgi:hypothetical protein